MGNGALPSGYLLLCPYTHRHCPAKWEQERQDTCSCPASGLPMTADKPLSSNASSFSSYLYSLSPPTPPPIFRHKSYCEGYSFTINFNGIQVLHQRLYQ